MPHHDRQVDGSNLTRGDSYGPLGIYVEGGDLALRPEDPRLRQVLAEHRAEEPTEARPDLLFERGARVPQETLDAAHTLASRCGA